MRKALALLLVLVLICFVGMIGAHAVINAERDQVTITENIIYGDKLAADGLNVIRNAQWQYHLHWSTDYNISAENRYSTEFDFTQREKRDERIAAHAPAELSFSGYINGGMGSDSGIGREELSEFFTGLEELCLDVMERAPAGAEYTEYVKLSDYCEFYPLFLSIDLPMVYYLKTDDNGNQYVRFVEGNDCEPINTALREYFKIPVDREELLEVRVYKAPNGAVTSLDLYCAAGGSRFYVLSAVTEKAAYFTFDTGSKVDFSRIPGGYGIYCLPFSDELTFKGETYPTVSVDELEMLYPLDTDTVIQSMFTDKSEERLILLTRENSKELFTVIDLDTMETLQRFEIGSYDERGSGWYISESEDYLVLTSGCRIAVIDILENGDYSLNYVVDRCPEEMADALYYTTEIVTAYDGERLALGWSFHKDTPPYRSCGFSIAVYNRTGLLYYGDYESGLMSGMESSYQYICQQTNYDSLLLEWK